MALGLSHPAGLYRLSPCGSLWLAFRKEFRILTLLLIWFAAIIAPLILFGQVMYARSTRLGAAPPLLLLLSLAIVDFLTWLADKSQKPWPAPAVEIRPLRPFSFYPPCNPSCSSPATGRVRKWLVATATNTSPALDLRSRRPDKPSNISAAPLLKVNPVRRHHRPRMGPARRRPLGLSRPHPQTSPSSGATTNPNRKSLTPQPDGTYLLGRDKWKNLAPESVHIPDNAMIYYSINNPFHRRDDVDLPAQDHLAAAGNEVEGLTIYFPDHPVETPQGDGESVMLLLLKRKNEQLPPTQPAQ